MRMKLQGPLSEFHKHEDDVEILYHNRVTVVKGRIQWRKLKVLIKFVTITNYEVKEDLVFGN